MSVGIDIDTRDLQRLQSRLLKVSRMKFDTLLHALGDQAEEHSRDRIQNTKTGPDGKKWRPWSEKYAASKHGAKNHDPHPGQLTESQNHTLLSLRGGLLDSMHNLVTFDEVEVGSNIEYAHYQNEMRPFVGMSSDDSKEAIDVIEDFLDRETKGLR